jgi:Permuted papain-like amidase enzyme, YaeF/YiiX, C92 family
MSWTNFRPLLVLVIALGSAPGCIAGRSGLPGQAVGFVQSQSRGSAILRVAEWNQWADEHLQDGDIVFMRGDGYILMGTVNFSKVSTDVTDSRFSHVGMIAVDDGHAYVYDIRNDGTHRTRFGELLADRHLHQVAIKRLRDIAPDAQSGIAEFCRNAKARNEKFDLDLKLDNGRLYCSEMVEVAYRSVDHPLSEPIPIKELPNYDKHPHAIRFVSAMTRIEPDQPVLLPGNDRFGIWSNPELDLVLDLSDVKTFPPDTKDL